MDEKLKKKKNTTEIRDHDAKATDQSSGVTELISQLEKHKAEEMQLEIDY